MPPNAEVQPRTRTGAATERPDRDGCGWLDPDASSFVSCNAMLGRTGHSLDMRLNLTKLCSHFFHELPQTFHSIWVAQ